MKTLIYIDNLERLNFFSEIMKSLQNEKEFIIITNKLSVYVKIFNKYKTYLLKDYKVLEKLTILYTFEMVFIWNGLTPIRKKITHYFKALDIPIRFLDIGNFPNKLFVDPLGVNAHSLVYKNPEVLDNLDVSEIEFKRWKNDYLHKNSQVQQANNRSKIRYLMVLDYIGYLFGAIKEDDRNPLKVIINKIKNKKTKIYSIEDLKQEYIFFPLQVSNDTQILYNSDIKNIEAIKLIMKKYPSEKNFIKIHPAEEDNEFIQKVEMLQNENLVLVSNDTKELIKNAQKIITINSTVGLEAMIIQKDVEILGRALYEKFDQKRLKNYICGYLVNIDYFGSDYNKDEVLRLYE